MKLYLQEETFLPESAPVAYGFFGRDGGVSKGIYASLNCGPGSNDDPAKVHENRQIVKQNLELPPEASLLTLHQIHSDICLYAEEPWLTQDSREADAMVTDKPNMAIGILTADCAPVLFYGEKDDGAPIIAAAHAGWKGALAGILENTVRVMREKGGSPGTFRAVIGPAIGPNSYEVDDTFRAAFLQKDNAYETYFSPRDKAYLFDLPSFCADRLHAAGVKKVSNKDLDTFFNEEDYFSFRRASHRKDPDYGRQISVIALR